MKFVICWKCCDDDDAIMPQLNIVRYFSFRSSVCQFLRQSHFYDINMYLVFCFEGNNFYKLMKHFALKTSTSKY